MDSGTHNDENSPTQGRARLSKVLHEKSKLNISISKRSRKINFGSNKNGITAVSLQRQTLRSNNRALAKALQQHKQELQKCNNLILQLTNEKRAMEMKLNSMIHISNLKNAEIEQEVQKRLEAKLSDLKEIFSRIGYMAGRGLDTLAGDTTSRSGSLERMNNTSLDETSGDMNWQRSIYTRNDGTQSVSENLSAVVQKALLDEIGTLPFEDGAARLSTVSEIEELKRRSSTRKSRRSAMLESDTLRQFQTSSARNSVEVAEETSTSEKRTPRNSEERPITEEERSTPVAPSGSGSTEPMDVQGSKPASPEEQTAQKVVHPDDRPLNIGRQGKATFTFIAFENEKPKSPGGLKVPVLSKKAKAALPKKPSVPVGKDKLKKNVSASRLPKQAEMKKVKSNDGKESKNDDELKKDVLDVPEKIVKDDELQAETSETDPKNLRRGTFFVPNKGAAPAEAPSAEEHLDKTDKTRRGTFFVSEPTDTCTPKVAADRRGTFAVPNPTVDFQPTLPTIQVDSPKADDHNDSLGILSTTILDNADMEFTCNFSGAEIQMDSGVTDVPMETDLGPPEIVAEEPKMLEKEAATVAAEIASNATTGVEKPVSPVKKKQPRKEKDSSQESSADESSSRKKQGKSDESSDEGKKDKKFGLYRVKHGKIQFVAGRKNADGKFKIPQPVARSKSKNLKGRSKSKQSKPVELPTSNPPSTFDFLGLTPEKPPGQSVLDKNPKKQGKKKSDDSLSEVSSNEEGRMEFGGSKKKKNACMEKVAKPNGQAREAADKSNSGSEASDAEAQLGKEEGNRRRTVTKSGSADAKINGKISETNSEETEKADPVSKRRTITKKGNFENEPAQERSSRSKRRTITKSRRMTVTILTPAKQESFENESEMIQENSKSKSRSKRSSHVEKQMKKKVPITVSESSSEDLDDGSDWNPEEERGRKKTCARKTSEKVKESKGDKSSKRASNIEEQMKKKVPISISESSEDFDDGSDWNPEEERGTKKSSVRKTAEKVKESKRDKSSKRSSHVEEQMKKKVPISVSESSEDLDDGSDWNPEEERGTKKSSVRKTAGKVKESKRDKSSKRASHVEEQMKTNVPISVSESSEDFDDEAEWIPEEERGTKKSSVRKTAGKVKREIEEEAESKPKTKRGSQEKTSEGTCIEISEDEVEILEEEDFDSRSKMQNTRTKENRRTTNKVESLEVVAQERGVEDLENLPSESRSNIRKNAATLQREKDAEDKYDVYDISDDEEPANVGEEGGSTISKNQEPGENEAVVELEVEGAVSEPEVKPQPKKRTKKKLKKKSEKQPISDESSDDEAEAGRKYSKPKRKVSNVPKKRKDTLSITDNLSGMDKRDMDKLMLDVSSNVTLSDMPNFWETPNLQAEKDAVVEDSVQAGQVSAPGAEKPGDGRVMNATYEIEDNAETRVENSAVQSNENSDHISKVSKSEKIPMDVEIDKECKESATKSKKVNRTKDRKSKKGKKPVIKSERLSNMDAVLKDLDIQDDVYELEDKFDDVPVVESAKAPKRKSRLSRQDVLEDISINVSPPVTKRERKSSRVSIVLENDDDDEPASKRSRRNRGVVSYKEPAMNVKMRQGYKMSCIKYDGTVAEEDETNDNKEKKKKGTKVKKLKAEKD